MPGRQWQEGATAVEYSIMAAAIAAVIVAVVVLLGSRTCETYQDASQKLATAQGSTAGTCS